MYIAELGKAVIDGVISIPGDLAYGARRTYEDIAGSPIVKEQNRAERQRVMQALKQGMAFGSSEAGPISKIVKIIITEFYDMLPDSTIEAIAKEAGLGTGYMSGRVATQVALTTLIVRKIAKEIALKSTAKRAAKFGVGAAATALILQGLIERASESSKRLQRTHPKIHYSLKIKNLDMALILVEDGMKPILDAIKVGQKNKEEFDRLVERMINEN